MNVDFTFTDQNVLLITTGIFVVIVGTILLGKWYLNRQSRNNLTEKYKANHWSDSPLNISKKYPAVDAFQWSGTFFWFGLLLSLSLALGAFNWTSYEERVELPDYADLELEVDLEVEPPRSSAPPPPPPPPPPPVIQEVPDELILEDEEVEFVDQSVDAKTAVEVSIPIEMAKEEKAAPPPPPPPPPPPAPEVKEIFKVVEQMPRFPGCEDMAGSHKEKKACANKKLLEFVYKNITYPALARENNVEGTVVIQFVVNANGSISDAKVVRDIGATCGDEALRVVKLMQNMPQKWTPGKQRGRAVAVQFNLPVRFHLAST
ncbi:MAG: energy transducer TonB [Saprospiraceae bacterium]